MKTKWFAMIAASNLVLALGVIIPEVQAGVTLRGESELNIPVRPERPSAGIGDEIKELVTEFRSKVSEFQTEQKELIARMKSATKAEREEIREQLKANREELKQAKEEFKDSVKELSGSLKDHAAKVSAEARAENRGGRSRE